MVYLLCFDRNYHHAKHYIGYVDGGLDDLEERVKRHKSGDGARLLQVITEAGIGFKVTRVWPDGDRNFERRLKNRKNSKKLCPLCSGHISRCLCNSNEVKV